MAKGTRRTTKKSGKSKPRTEGASSAADLGFEQQLWKAADALRNNMDAAEYKHVVLGLIFLKYISDAFEAKHAELAGSKAKGADPEDPDEYRAENIFWVPSKARWSHLLKMAKQPTIGKVVDDAMDAIERDNATLNRGSTQPLLTQTDLKSQPMVLPRADLLHRFHDVASSLLGASDQREKQSATLASLRDALLPKLISGELRIADAEKIVGRAT